MNVAVLSESSADEAAIRILVDGILGAETEAIPPPPLRTRGWPSVLNVVATVVRHLHYRTDADAFVLVVDSDDSPVHDPAHDEPGAASKQCRLCQLRECIDEVRTTLSTVAGRSPLRTAVGLATPCIEAWYRCGLGAHVNEAAWARELKAGSGFRDKRRRLKREVYGTDRPSLELEIRRATEEAHRLVQDLSRLQRLFPNGFGALARNVRDWQAGQGPVK